MIELHRPETSSICDSIEEEFGDMMVRYKRVIYPDKDIQNSKGDDKRLNLPFIDDGKEVAKGEQEIRKYMDQLKIDVKTMNEFTADACYIDPDTGEIC